MESFSETTKSLKPDLTPRNLSTRLKPRFEAVKSEFEDRIIGHTPLNQHGINFDQRLIHC